MSNPEWTSLNGKANSSPKYLEIVEVVRRILGDSGHFIVHGQLEAVARLIVSQLAHNCHVGPEA